VKQLWSCLESERTELPTGYPQENVKTCLLRQLLPLSRFPSAWHSAGKKKLMPHRKIIPNDLLRYRERLGFTQQHVAAALGLRDATVISKLERQQRLPRLDTALRLSAMYRVPVEFLFSKMYEQVRLETRNREDQMGSQNRGTKEEGGHVNS